MPGVEKFFFEVDIGPAGSRAMVRVLFSLALAQTLPATISGAGRKGRGGRKIGLVTLNRMLLALPESCTR